MQDILTKVAFQPRPQVQSNVCVHSNEVVRLDVREAGRTGRPQEVYPCEFASVYCAPTFLGIPLSQKQERKSLGRSIIYVHVVWVTW